jgi:aryl-phospho-beta-D-glucosidase BglC (GH1 family)
MSEQSNEPTGRRDFLRMAAVTGAAALAGGGPSLAQSGAGKMEFLTTRGRDIVNSRGERVRLRGTSVGGWMNMEDFINGHTGAEHTLRAQMAETLGAARAEFFFDRLLDHFFGEDDIVFLRKTGVNVVRLPLNYRHFEDDAAPFKYKASGFARLDAILKLCEAHGLYVVLDLHSVQGWQNVHWHSDNASRISLFWQDAAYQDRFVALWREFARRYRGRAVVAGYDLINEPCTGVVRGDFPFNIEGGYRPNWDRINAVYRRVIGEIRKIDPDHILFVEGDNYAKLFSGLERPMADHVVYNSHNYTVPGFGPGRYPGAITPRSGAAAGRPQDWDAARQEKAFLETEGVVYAQKHGVPLWVSEFGAVYNGPPEETPDRLRALDDQIAVMERAGASWTTWTYKDVGVMGMMTLSPTSPYMARLADFQKKKRALGTDDWMKWLPPTPVKDATVGLADQIAGVVADPALDAGLNGQCVKQTLLSFYTGGLMQPLYASLFKGLSETEIDGLLASFSAAQCVRNEGLVGVMGKYAAMTA